MADGDKRGRIILGELTHSAKSVLDNFVAISEGGDITGSNIAGDHCTLIGRHIG